MRLYGPQSWVPIYVETKTTDGESVKATSWWEENGRVHRSFLSGVEKHGGGSFESKRYLLDNGSIYVCETTFHPNDV